jgi:hypothetical protein
VVVIALVVLGLAPVFCPLFPDAVAEVSPAVAELFIAFNDTGGVIGIPNELFNYIKFSEYICKLRNLYCIK